MNSTITPYHNPLHLAAKTRTLPVLLTFIFCSLFAYAQTQPAVPDLSFLSQPEHFSFTTATVVAQLGANITAAGSGLEAACNRTSFSSQQKIDFIVPNCPVSSNVWIEVKKAFAGPVPEDITDAQVESAARTLTNINYDMLKTGTGMQTELSDILKIYVDSAIIMDEMLYFLRDTVDTKESYKIAVGACLEIDSIWFARELLDALEPELADDIDTVFYEYHNIAVSLAEEEKTWFEMSEPQLEQVLEIAQTDYEEAIYAQAVLSLIFDSVYVRNPENLPEGFGKWDEEEEPTVEQQQDEVELKSFSVYPNPFYNSFNLTYAFDKDVNELKFEVYDVTGRTVIIQTLNNTAGGTTVINTGSCLGVYLLRVTADEHQVYYNKMICLER